MEFRSIKLELATADGRIQNFKRSTSLQVSHLLFEDDLLLFCRANRKSLNGVNTLLNDLMLNTGLRTNRSKSKIFFSKGCTEETELSNILDISVGRLPVKCLGLHFTVQYPEAKHFSPLIDKLRARIEGWIMHSLSFAGRIELIKSTLYSTMNYWIQSYSFPISLSKEIERICANFLRKGI